MKKQWITTLLCVILPWAVWAGDSEYSIEISIPQLSEGEELHLGYYFGDTSFLQDTVVVDSKGKATFEGSEALPGGMYLVVLPKQKYFDILLADDQKFRIAISDTAAIVETAKISGSVDNQLLYDYQRYITRQQQAFNVLQQRRDQNHGNTDSLQVINRATKAVEDEIEAHWQQLVADHPETFFATLLRGMNGAGSRASQFGYFFDNVDFSDKRLLRTPVIYKSIRYVLARNLNQNKPPGFIIEELEQLIEKASANPKVYEYTVAYLLSFFNSFQRLGMNRVFVFIAENYVLDGRADWFSDADLKSIEERTTQMRASFVGANAPDVAMESVAGDTIRLHATTKPYTLLFFWSTGCGHCEAATEAINEFLNNTGDEKVAVYAVFTKDSHPDWEKYIEDYEIQDWINVWDKDNSSDFRTLYYVVSTPLLYVLDKEKKIIGFRAGDGPIIELLNELEPQLNN